MHMATDPSFGAWMRRRRRQLDLTQDELAQQAGCSTNTIHKLEADERRPSKQLAERLALFLAMPAEEKERFVAFARAKPNQEVGPPESPVAAELWAEPLAPPLPKTPRKRLDWGEAPDVTAFYGRMAEREQLRRWLVDERCRLVALLGMGGIGKTALATWMAQELADHFELILWRSLRNAPPLGELLDEFLDFLTDGKGREPESSIERRMGRLVDALAERRALIVLDNGEAILQAGAQAGHNRPGYEGYGDLLQTVGQGRHQGCLLLTTREKPREIARLEGTNAPVRSLTLRSLTAAEGSALLADKGIEGDVGMAGQLTARYSGNPLALQVAAETIRELFGGDIAAFLRQETAIIGDVRELLAAHFDRLSPLEQELWLWLAVEREAVSVEELAGDLVQPVGRVALLERLSSLRRRSLVEQSEMGFTLQNVVMEFLTDYLVERDFEEMSGGRLHYLQSHALVKAQAKEYVRESQVRLLMQPLAQRLVAVLGQKGVEGRVRELLAQLRAGDAPLVSAVADHAPPVGYAGGNLLNLLLALKCNLRGWDFSHLAIWQAALQDVRAQQVSFRHAAFAKSTFTNVFGHGWSNCFSPDGTLLAVGGSDGEICLWRVLEGEASRELLLLFHAHHHWVMSLAFLPGGEVLASAGTDGAIYLWHLPSLLAAPFGEAKPLRRFLGHSHDFVFLAIHPQGHLLASAGEDQTVRLWDIAGGACLAVLFGHEVGYTSVAFTPDGKKLISAGFDGLILVRDVESGAILSKIDSQQGQLRALAVSPDGALMATGGEDGTIYLWDIERGESVLMLAEHADDIASLAFHPNGLLLLSSSFDRTIRLWRIERAAAATGAGRDAAAASGECVHVFYGYGASVGAIALRPDGTLLSSVGVDQTMRLWDLRTLHCVQKFVGYEPWLRALAFHPGGEQLVCGDALGIFRWHLPSGERLHALDDRTVGVWALCYSPNGRLLASAGVEGTIALWEPETGRCVGLLVGHTDTIWTMSFHPDGNLLASAGFEGQPILLWDLESMQCVARLEWHTEMCNSVAFSPDGSLLASGGLDRYIVLWEVASRRLLRVIHSPEGVVWSLAFSPDGRLLFSGGYDHYVRVWDVETGRCLRVLKGHTQWVMGMSCSPDGKLVASVSEDATVRVWDVQSGECVRVLVGHRNKGRSVCFSPDGKTLASSSSDQTVRLWDVARGECVHVLPCDGPYQGMDITGVTGLTQGQFGTLKQLGAVADG